VLPQCTIQMLSPFDILTLSQAYAYAWKTRNMAITTLRIICLDILSQPKLKSTCFLLIDLRSTSDEASISCSRANSDLHEDLVGSFAGKFLQCHD
jgi:hypothetical protein